ncbi:MAG: hypothetical protein Q4C71_03965 [Microbacteriaceae bacterium]|nr:hypothetical protein [Microbacteriaceae bacterium]
MSNENGQELKSYRAEADDARADLRESLQLIAEKLNYPKRISGAVSRGKEKFAGIRKENPGKAVAILSGAAAAAGLVVTGITFAIVRKFRSDD